MRRISVYLSILLFTIWILPLGAFIRPDQESRVCDGQRAICLCTQKMKEARPATPLDTVWQLPAGNANKDSSGFSSQSFLPVSSGREESPAFEKYFTSFSIPDAQVFPRPVEHVPKAVRS